MERFVEGVVEEFDWKSEEDETWIFFLFDV